MIVAVMLMIRHFSKRVTKYGKQKQKVVIVHVNDNDNDG